MAKSVSTLRHCPFMTVHVHRDTVQCEALTHTLNATLRNTQYIGAKADLGGGWVGLGEGLTWSPTHGPRRLPCRTRPGGCTRVSGHKAYRTADRPQTPRWRSRAGDAAVPVCMCPCVFVEGGGGAVAHLLAPLLFGVGAHGAGKCVPGAPGPGREAGEPDSEPAGGDVGLGSQPPRH